MIGFDPRRVFFVFVFLLTLAFYGCNQGTNDTSGKVGLKNEKKQSKAKIEFIETEHDFGTLNEGEVVSFTFHFKNVGTGNLLITSASASCGCTVPKYDRDPIPGGGTGSLEVVFNTKGKSGKQHKTVGIRTNGQPNFVLLNIFAEVIPEEDKN